MPSLPSSHSQPPSPANASSSSFENASTIDSASTTRAIRFAQRRTSQNQEGPLFATAATTVERVTEQLEYIIVTIEAIAFRLGMELSPLPSANTDPNVTARAHSRRPGQSETSAPTAALGPATHRTTLPPPTGSDPPFVSQMTTVPQSNIMSVIRDDPLRAELGARAHIVARNAPPLHSSPPKPSIKTYGRDIDPLLCPDMPIKQPANPPSPIIVRSAPSPKPIGPPGPPEPEYVVQEFRNRHARAVRRARLRHLIPDWTDSGLGNLTSASFENTRAGDDEDPYETLFDLHVGIIDPSLDFRDQPSEHQDRIMDAYVLFQQQTHRVAADEVLTLAHPSERADHAARAIDALYFGPDGISESEANLAVYAEDLSIHQMDRITLQHLTLSSPSTTDGFDPLFLRQLELRARQARRQRENQPTRLYRGPPAPESTDHYRTLQDVEHSERRLRHGRALHRSDREEFLALVSGALPNSPNWNTVSQLSPTAWTPPMGQSLPESTIGRQFRSESTRARNLHRGNAVSAISQPPSPAVSDTSDLEETELEDGLIEEQRRGLTFSNVQAAYFRLHANNTARSMPMPRPRPESGRGFTIPVLPRTPVVRTHRVTPRLFDFGRTDASPTPSSPIVSAAGPGSGFEETLQRRIQETTRRRAGRRARAPESASAPTTAPPRMLSTYTLADDGSRVAVTEDRALPEPAWAHLIPRDIYDGFIDYPTRGVGCDGSSMMWLSREHHIAYLLEVRELRGLMSEADAHAAAAAAAAAVQRIMHEFHEREARGRS